jgi:subtilisin family serine protease
MYLSQYTGLGVRVAVVDSGVHAAHPHVGGVEQGVGIRSDGTLDDDFIDRLGHGTAVTAAIREKAPDAALVAVKVFWRTLATDAMSLVRGIDEACARHASVINLSLGTSNASHRRPLEAAVTRAAERGAVVVAAGEDGRVQWLPGSLDGVLPVKVDASCERDAYTLIDDGGRIVIGASPYPREIPGVPRERNLHGISFAIGNASGFVARALEALGPPAGRHLSAIVEVLKQGLVRHSTADLKGPPYETMAGQRRERLT